MKTNVYFHRGESIIKLERGYEVEGSFDIYKTLEDARNFIDKRMGGYCNPFNRPPERHNRMDNIRVIGEIDYSKYEPDNKVVEYIYYDKPEQAERR